MKISHHQHLRPMKRNRKRHTRAKRLAVRTILIIAAVAGFVAAIASTP